MPIRWGIVFAVWAAFAAMFALDFGGHIAIWERVFGVPVMGEHFADLAQIPAAVDSARRGFNPYVDNPSDIEHRRFLYPKAWIYLFRGLRIGPKQTNAAGFVMACCFLLAVSWLVLRQTDGWAAALIGVAAFSSAGALAVERGNTDIFIFCLVILVIEVGSRTGSRAAVWLLLAAAVLKVYPVFALAAAGVWRRWTRLLPVVLLLAAAGIVAGRGGGGDAKMNDEVPHGYGVKEIDVAMQRAPAQVQAAFAAHRGLFRFTWQLSLLFLASSGAFAGVRYAKQRTPALGRGGIYARGSYAFVVCAGIFVGTFLVSTSYDYRLIFLLPLLPLLVVQARRSGEPRLRRLGAIGAALIVLGVNRGTTSSVHLPVITPMLKAAFHLDLWVLLWIVSFFLGLIFSTRYRDEETNPGTPASLHDRLLKEHAW